MSLYRPENNSVQALFSLLGCVSLITGGTRGIGYSATLGLAEAGSDIALVYNASPEGTNQAIADRIAQENNVKVKIYKADVTKKKEIAAVVEEVVRDFGKLDIVVANSGINSVAPAEDFTEEEYRNIMSVNLDGAFFTAQAAANAFKKLKEQGKINQGKIIFTVSASTAVVNYPQKQAPYNASKSGLLRLAKCLAVEWMTFARVNCVSPGYTETEMIHTHPQEWRDTWSNMIPAKRTAATYEMKGSYVFLASDASSYMTGAELMVDGGYTLI
ncbi:oxidoreductase [Dipodascopsis uninucleata]